MSGDSSTLRPHGGYRRLRSFQVTEIIYDGTVAFCDRFVDKRSRTHDQMVRRRRAGGAQRAAEHRGGQQGFGDFESDGAAVGERRARRPR